MKAVASEGCPVVLDASVTGAWFLQEQQTEPALRLLPPATAGFHVPAIWAAEVGNLFLLQERRGQLSRQQCAVAFHTLGELPIFLDSVASELSVMGRLVELARAHGLSVYDAQYLELAMRKQLPLATLDKKLATAARAGGIVLAL